MNLPIRRLLIKERFLADYTAAKHFHERSALIIGSDTQLWREVEGPEGNSNEESADEFDHPDSSSSFYIKEPMPVGLGKQSKSGSDGSTSDFTDASSNSLFSGAIPLTTTLLTGTVSSNGVSRLLGHFIPSQQATHPSFQAFALTLETSLVYLPVATKQNRVHYLLRTNLNYHQSQRITSETVILAGSRKRFWTV